MVFFQIEGRSRLEVHNKTVKIQCYKVLSIFLYIIVTSNLRSSVSTPLSGFFLGLYHWVCLGPLFGTRIECV